jgi:hypothetical protein
VVTVRSTVPAPALGEVAVHNVSELQATKTAALGPKLAAVPSTNPVPVIVTTVPPPSGPPFGLMEVIAGVFS